MNSGALPISVWSHRFAAVLCGLTFPLIWVGGLITTTDAGMAVPDWPGTYGSNLFLYPWSTWLFGPWDLFIEHGHRLLAALVGLVSIGFVAVCWRSSSTTLRRLAWSALALVIFQGLLGGLRVVGNERLLALAHGVTGPLFFALTCGIVGWLHQRQPATSPAPRFRHLATSTSLLVFAQLALGAALRHLPESASPWSFAVVVKFHLLGAAVVAVMVMWLACRATFGRGWPRGIRVAGGTIGLVLVLQLLAGLGTWVLKYGLPGWAGGGVVVTMDANVADGWWQTIGVTTHQAGGSLLLGLATYLAARTLASDP